MRLGFIGRRHLKIRQRANYRLAGSIEKRLVMGAVIDEKFFILVSGAEMAPQQRQYPVLRLDFPAQNAAQLGKADKALQQMGLTVEVPARRKRPDAAFRRKNFAKSRGPPAAA